MDKSLYKSKKEVNEFLFAIKNTDKSNFIVLTRRDELKNPHQFLLKLDYDVDDLINEIKSLTYKDYLNCQIDSKNKFLFMYSFIKEIKTILCILNFQ